jgi:hypothetical protein
MNGGVRPPSASAPPLPRDSIPSAAREALAPAAPWIERLARVGFAAKAILYTVVGIVALQAAFGNGGGTTGSQGALQTLVRQPFGSIALVAIAAGLFGYAAWRLIEAVVDPERRGNGPKGIALRTTFAARGLFHAALGVEAARLSIGAGGSNGQGAEAWTARVLDAPLGPWLVMATGVSIVAYGGYQLYRAWAAKLSRQLDLASLSRDGGTWVVRVCRTGIAARGIVFLVIGAFLARAGQAHSAEKAADTGEALAVIGRQPFGPWLLAGVAIGLIAYAVYEMVQARYRVIRPA